MSSEPRTRPVSREENSREKKERPQVWRRPSRLPTFDHIDDDYHYRWVRYELRGESESSNVLQRVREGYEAVRPEDVGMTDFPTVEDGRFEGTLISGDLLLMRIPKVVAEQRNEYYRQRASGMQSTVDHELKESDDQLMPISKSTKNTTTTGRPHFRDDD